uniref:Uncharacterized protein n=1 Tax=Acidobacterium capsulatum TaxID=33075 RepID=A0A7V4XRT1_9BACT
MSDDSFDAVRAAWRSGSEESYIVSVEELRARAKQLSTSVRRRNLAEYCAAAVVAVIDGYYFVHFGGLLARAGSALMLAAIAWIVWHLHQHGSTGSMPAQAQRSLDFLTGELIRQRDLLRHVWNWYLLPLVPGMTLFLLGLHAIKGAGGAPLVSERAILHTVAACVIGFALIAFANNRIADELQRQIDHLSSLKADPDANHE